MSADNRLAGTSPRAHNAGVGADRSFRWRPIRPGDAGNWAGLLAAIQAEDRDWSYYTEQDLLEEFSDPRLDFARGSVADGHGRVRRSRPPDRR